MSTFYTVNKDSKGFLFSGSAGALINIILNALLIPLMGVHGEAFVTCVSYICVFFYRIRDTRKYMKIEVFRMPYILGYGILIFTAASMFIPGYVGQGILITELVVIMLLNIEFIKECLKIVELLLNKMLHR